MYSRPHKDEIRVNSSSNDKSKIEIYSPIPFEQVRRLAKPPDSGWRQMIRGIVSIKHTGYDRK